MLSPSYDLMNTKIHLSDNYLALNLFEELEQTNLPLGKIYNYTRKDFIEFGKRLNIRDKMISKIIDMFIDQKKELISFVDKSFLSEDVKDLYQSIVISNYKMFAK